MARRKYRRYPYDWKWTHSPGQTFDMAVQCHCDKVCRFRLFKGAFQSKMSKAIKFAKLNLSWMQHCEHAKGE